MKSILMGILFGVRLFGTFFIAALVFWTLPKVDIEASFGDIALVVALLAILDELMEIRMKRRTP